LILKQQDAIGCVAFDDDVRAKVPIRSKRTHLQSVIESLSVTEPRDKTDMQSIFRNVAESYPRRGMVVVVSDLLTDPKALLKGLKLLRRQGHDVMVFHIMDDDELDFPFTGPTRFDGLESADYLNCNPRALREGYLEAVNEFLDEVRRGCAHNTVDYALIRTSEPLDAALATYLSTRLGMHRKN
jgi:uncharacterized protein (DUF58 family)